MLFQAIKKTEFLAKTPKIWNSQKGPPFGYFWQRLIFFFKNWKFEKRLCWNMSSTERNKVKSFGDPSIAHREMADRFLIVEAFNAPPPLLQIGLSKLRKSGCICLTQPNIVQFWKLKSLLKAYKKFDWFRALAHSFCACSSSPGTPEIYCLV